MKRGGLLIAGMAAGLVLAPGAAAKTFDVSRTGDTAPNGCGNGGCTLREAIIAANSHAGADVVELKARKTYSLSQPGQLENAAATGDLDVTDPLAIRSSHPRRRATVDANAIDRVFHLHARTAFNAVTITDGDAPSVSGDEDGSGIYAQAGSLRLRRSRVVANHQADDGEGIASEGSSLTLVRTAVRSNLGDGVRQEGDGSVVLTRSRVTGNAGVAVQDSDSGGVQLRRSVVAGSGQIGLRESGDGDVSVVRSTVSGSGEEGVLEQETGDLILRRARIVGNGLVGAQDSGSGSLQVFGSTVAGNDNRGLATFGGDRGRILRTTVRNNTTPDSGAGIFDGSDTGLLIKGSTISNNTSLDSGGGIWTGTPVTIVNSTLSGNRAGLSGGAIRADGATAEIRLNAVTIVRNVANFNDTSTNTSGGGISANNSATFPGTRNALIALNRADFGASFPDCNANIESGGHNLLGDDDGCSGLVGSDLVRANPKISKLRDNGGPTKTVALKRGSPAIGKAGNDAPSRDQRGVKRDKNPDIGAFER